MIIKNELLHISNIIGICLQLFVILLLFNKSVTHKLSSENVVPKNKRVTLTRKDQNRGKVLLEVIVGSLACQETAELLVLSLRKCVAILASEHNKG